MLLNSPPLSQTVTSSQTPPSVPLERDVLYGRPLLPFGTGSRIMISLLNYSRGLQSAACGLDVARQRLQPGRFFFPRIQTFCDKLAFLIDFTMHLNDFKFSIFKCRVKLEFHLGIVRPTVFCMLTYAFCMFLQAFLCLAEVGLRRTP